MKKEIIILLVLLASGLNSKLSAGDQIETEPFHSIIVSSELIAELILSKNESIEPAFENASEKNLIVEVVDSVLKIRMKTGKYKDASLNIKIHYNKDLKMLEANGRGQIWSDEDIYLDNALTVKLFNGGEMRFTLVCDSLSATLSQGAVIHLKGETRALNVKTSTNATFSGYEFKSRKADVTASSTGKAKISVSEYLNANASSKGFIGYISETARVIEKTSLKGEILKTYLE